MRGKAIRRDGCIGLRRDHPRVCGEKYQLGVVKPLHEGSPPRMRGKAYKGADQTTRRGITPAYAGKSRAGVCIVGDFGDHPRVCGEKYSLALFLGLHQGSPPRMRGKGGIPGSCRTRKGITPAYAGKRPCRPDWCARRWDHPRVCGEKPRSGRHLRGVGGSPPRMRGKAVWKDIKRAEKGITPAYAGKSPRG